MWLPGVHIPELLPKLQNPEGIEIGMLEGLTTEYLLRSIPNLRLHGIDPYKFYKDWDGTRVHGTDANYQAMLARTKEYPNFFHYSMTSDEAVDSFPAESMDFVFIDGDHTYHQVRRDMENYYGKVKPGGLFCGHDYTQIRGVNMAVKGFAEKLGKTIKHFPDQDMWYWYKD
jgi:hypothetical protein